MFPKESSLFDWLRSDTHFLVLIYWSRPPRNTCWLKLREIFTVRGYFWARLAENI